MTNKELMQWFVDILKQSNVDKQIEQENEEILCISKSKQLELFANELESKLSELNE